MPNINKKNNQRKRICFVAPGSVMIGGISTWFSIIKEQIGSLFETLIIDTSPGDFISKKEPRLLRLLKAFFKVPKQKKQLIAYYKQAPIDILHIATSGGFGFYRDYTLLKIAKKHNIKTILHLHFGRLPTVLCKRKGIEYRLFIKCLKYVDNFIAIDEKTESSLKLFCKNSNVDLIPNPVPEKEYCYDEESKNVVFVGHVIKQKGITELINSFGSIYQIAPDWILNIVGPYNERYIKTLKLEKNIRIIGSVSHDVALDYISSSSFLVLPSYTEGMPNVILEAMSFGVPVLATDVGNVKNMIEGCGIIIESKSTAQLEKGIKTLIEDKNTRIEYSKKSFEKARDRYSPRVVFSQLCSAWDLK